MNAARRIIERMLDELPDEMMENVILYIAFIQSEKRTQVFKELEHASLSSTDFWDNPIDDEVWNDV